MSEVKNNAFRPNWLHQLWVKSGPGAHLELGPFTLQQRTSGDYVGASGSCQVPNAGNLSVQISIRVIRTRISLL